VMESRSELMVVLTLVQMTLVMADLAVQDISSITIRVEMILRIPPSSFACSALLLHYFSGELRSKLKGHPGE
jgi:hypothetical protein